MANYSYNKRNHFYDVRNLPYGYYGMHPMDVLEYQRGRPTKLPVRLLNRQFKSTTIQFGEDQKPQLVVISVQQLAKNKQPFLVLSNTCAEDTEDGNATDCVSIPESLAPQMVLQLRKLAKWKPHASATTSQLPSAGQGLIFEDAVFKSQIVNLTCTDAAPSEVSSKQQFAIKILAESRARDPQERRERSSVLVPMEPGTLVKLKSALADLVVTESPLYHTESMQCSDGSKFYLDLIKDEAAHYLKVSHVTRDFRSIVIVPAGDVEALRDLLSTSLKAMKTQQPQQQQTQQQQVSDDAKAGKRKRGGRNPRRRPPVDGPKRRGAEEKENNSETAAANTETADADAAVVASKQQQQDSEDSATVESRPVDSGDGSGEKALLTAAE